MRSSPEATRSRDVRVSRAFSEIDRGLDAGPDTIRWHLHHTHHVTASQATIARHLAAQGLIVTEGDKGPKRPHIRIQAEQPNECWQAGFARYQPTGRPPGPASERRPLNPQPRVQGFQMS